MQDLKPTNQKSFYGKAQINKKAPDCVELYSYGTLVCQFNLISGKFTRIWRNYSATTMKHINDFRNMYALKSMGKKEWESLPIEF